MNEISEYPPYPVKWPLMFQNWDRLTFLHWRYPADVIRALVPSELEIDTFDGAAWIGLTPFLLTGLRPPFLPALPWISQFPEMNVRTYVCGPDGERGIWFFSLEADRLAAVAGARLSYGLPYRWADMRVRWDATQVEYTSRRHTGRGQARIVVRRGSPLKVGERERFLTARFRLYTILAGRLGFAQIAHEPWPLESAALLKLDQDVIEHSNVPGPSGEPLVYFSPTLSVRIGRPKFLR
ncbi:MAG TPA: DUF2071 domain-containing protein [Bryobacteraceae bacterium]